MTGIVLPFPDRSAILVDRCPFGAGYEVEPYLCPAASGKGRWFPSFFEAHDYADTIARAAGTGVFVMCIVPEEDSK